MNNKNKNLNRDNITIAQSVKDWRESDSSFFVMADDSTGAIWQRIETGQRVRAASTGYSLDSLLDGDKHVNQ